MRTIIVAVALAVMLAGQVSAEPGPIGRWLMQEPVTLWDRGMDRAEKATEKAVTLTGPWLADTFREGDAYYDWNANEITLRMSVIGEAGASTHERCNELRRHFLAGIMGFNPTVFEKAPKLVFPIIGATKERLTRTIDGWFSHNGYQKESRDKKLGEKLAQIIFVEVAVFDDRANRSFECRARILEDEAASKPSG